MIDTVSKNLEDQASKRSVSEIEFKLNMFNAKAKGEVALSTALKSLTDSIDVNKIYNNNLNLYKDITDSRDYRKALRFYNNKGLSKMISRFFGLNSGEYGNDIVRLLSTEYKDAIISGIKKYAPNIPDR